MSVEISSEQARMMRHAVGKRWHRNYYVAAKGTEADSLWMLLEMAGCAREFQDGITMRTWRLTEAGIEALKAFEAKENT